MLEPLNRRRASKVTARSDESIIVPFGQETAVTLRLVQRAVTGVRATWLAAA